MLFGDLADDVYPYAGVVGFAIGLAVGLYHYWKAEEKKKADEDEENEDGDGDPEERTCPHCAARFTDAGDACCPDCRRPLDE